MQRTQQFVQRDLLLGRAVVLVLGNREIFHFSLFLFTSGENDFVLPVSAFIAHADAMRIVSFDVAASDAKGATVVERTITTHIEVITRVLAEATGPVACSEFLQGKVLARTGVGAVQDDQINCPEVRSLQVQTQRGQQFRP